MTAVFNFKSLESINADLFFFPVIRIHHSNGQFVSLCLETIDYRTHAGTDLLLADYVDFGLRDASLDRFEDSIILR